MPPLKDDRDKHRRYDLIPGLSVKTPIHYRGLIGALHTAIPRRRYIGKIGDETPKAPYVLGCRAYKY
jgi:hypothetical protein